MGDLKSLVENCGDESRSSNPILGFVDLLSKDKYNTRDQHSSKNQFNSQRNKSNHYHDSTSLSTKEFDQFNASLQQEFVKSHELFHPNRRPSKHLETNHRIRDYILHDREGPMIDQIIRQNQHKPNTNDWTNEFKKQYTHEDEMNEFNHVYNQKKQNRQWRQDYQNFEEYERFNSIYQENNTRKKEVDQLVNEFDQIQIDEIESVEYDDEMRELASKFNAYRDPRFRQSEFFNLMEKIGQQEGNKKDSTWAESFIEQDRPNGMVNDFISSNDLISKDWIDDYRDHEEFLMSDHFHELDQKKSFEEVFESTQEKYDSIWEDDDYDGPINHDLDQFIKNPISYPFSEENPFDNKTDQNNFEIGLELYKSGDLVGAIQAFEASVNQGEHEQKAMSYHYLGLAQAENDRDDLAILALLNALNLVPNHRPSLLSLSVSFANEVDFHKVYECLMKWLSLTDEYAHILKDSDDLINDVDNDHETVSEAFIRAARMRPNEPDPDVQIALGLLFNLTKEYNRSIDCFKSALIKRPDDYQLWNKLGATQANYGRCEDAIESYFHALSIRPTYTRARFNLGVSFAKLKDFTESAKSVLSALSINSDANHIWDFLGVVFKKMGRDDLRAKSVRKDVNLFTEDFNF